MRIRYCGRVDKRRRLPAGLSSAPATTILASIVMPISVHLPQPLLEAVDRKAKALRISRSQLIVRALERELHEASGWSTGFFERLSELDPGTAKAVDELLRDVRKARRSKPATGL